MNKDSAESIINNCTGFMDEGSSACEAWDYIQEYMHRMESALRFIVTASDGTNDPVAEVEAATDALDFANEHLFDSANDGWRRVL